MAGKRTKKKYRKHDYRYKEGRQQLAVHTLELLRQAILERAKYDAQQIDDAIRRITAKKKPKDKQTQGADNAEQTRSNPA